MKTILAKTAGFCFGVKRAVDTVYNEIALNEKNKIYTFGPIIHNDVVVSDLNEKGVDVINSTQELEGLKEATVIIRSHGVPKMIYDIIRKNNLKLVDATCPFVKKIHEIVEKHSAQGYEIIIVGDDKHPEVMGITGWSCKAPFVIKNTSEAEALKLDKNKKYCMVSQTTFNHNNFKNIVEIIEKKGYDILVLNTICNATHERQEEAERISKEVDVMIVIGNKDSSNTRKLYEICSKNCRETCYIQTVDDLDSCNFNNSTCVGITAGASTPNNIIEEVQNNVRNEF